MREQKFQFSHSIYVLIMKQRSTYLVEGMTCEGCERTVSKVVSSIDGVESSKADLKTATLSVEYDPSKVTLDHIKSAINKVGYRLAGQQPSLGQRKSSDEAIA